MQDSQHENGASEGDDLQALLSLRHALHRCPELSGQERATAATIVDALGPAQPDRIVTGLGGHGVAAVYDSGVAGPCVMVRAELDGLPIGDESGVAHASEIEGRGHMCGHDGHMVILVGIARRLARARPEAGRAVLLFQPAEENGTGATAVLDDPRFGDIAPDIALSLHNLPGVPLGQVALRKGPVNCASVGVRMVLRGATSHAAAPEAGRAPTAALAHLTPALQGLSRGTAGRTDTGFRLATITHLSMGAPAFGVAPGEAELWVTLRALSDEDLAQMLTEARRLATEAAARDGLDLSLSEADHFRACTNEGSVTDLLARAFEAEGMERTTDGLPMRASEDFGRFGDRARAAMAFPGAGIDHPMLHRPDYDFPDALVGPCIAALHRALTEALGWPVHYWSSR